MTFDLTRSLVEEGSLALSGNLLGLEANRGVDGRYYSQFGIGQSLYNVPFYAAGRAIQHMTGLGLGKPDSLLKAAVDIGSAVAAAGTVAIVFVFALVLTGRAVPALVCAAACGVGSLLWPYARFGFNAPLAAWLLTTTVTSLWLGVRHDRRHLVVIAGFVAGAAWLTRHEFVIVSVRSWCGLPLWVARSPGRDGDGARVPAGRSRRRWDVVRLQRGPIRPSARRRLSADILGRRVLGPVGVTRRFHLSCIRRA